jgi:hypothetical protein
VLAVSVTSIIWFLDAVLVPALLETVRPVFRSCHEITAALADTVPKDEVWRWRDVWTDPIIAAVFSVVFERFLTNGTLVPLPTVAEQLGSTSHTFCISMRGVQ